MLNNNNNKPIDIGILEISTPNKAILEFFFDGAGEALFKEARINNASAFIIDYDFPGAKESWKDIYESTQKPGIIISIHEVSLPSTIWIPKPLTSKTLTQAGIKIKALLQAKSQPAEPVFATQETVEKPVEQSLSEKESFNIADRAAAASPQLGGISTETSIEPSPVEKPSKPITDDVKDSHENEIDALLESLMEDNASHDILQNNSVTESIQAAKEETPSNQSKETVKSPPKTTVEQIETLNKPIEFSLEELPEEQIIEVEETPESIAPASKTFETPEVVSVDALSTETTPKNKLYVVENEKSSADLELFDSSSNKKTPSANAVVDEFDAPVESFVAEDIIIDESSFSASTEPATSIVLDQETVTPKKPDAVDNSKSPDDELQSLLEEIRQEADSEPSAESGNSTKRFNTVAEKRWFFTCGDINSPTTNAKDQTFKPDEHILSTFLNVLEQAKISKIVMRLKFKGVIIVIDTEVDSVYCDISTMNDDFAQICFEPIHEDTIKIHSLDKSEVRLYRKKMEVDPKKSHSIESFIWTMSLLCSRGRLPEGTKPNQKLGLKYWPNLTRLEPIPHAMQVSAVFKKHSGSLLDVSKWLNIPQAYVFAYYNAALALNLIENDQKKLSSLQSITQAKGKGENRGFFSRLLKRISK